MFTMRPPRERERRADVHREDSAQARHVEIDQRADRAELRRVVHEHVQAAQLARRAHEARARRRVGNVAVDGGDSRSPPGERCGGLLQRIPIARADDQVVAAPGEHARDDGAEAAAGARDDGDTIRWLHLS